MNDSQPPVRRNLTGRMVPVILVLLFLGLLAFVAQSIFISADVLTVPDYNPAEVKQRYSERLTTPSVTPSIEVTITPSSAL